MQRGEKNRELQNWGMGQFVQEEKRKDQKQTTPKSQLLSFYFLLCFHCESVKDKAVKMLSSVHLAVT